MIIQISHLTNMWSLYNTAWRQVKRQKSRSRDQMHECRPNYGEGRISYVSSVRQR